MTLETTATGELPNRCGGAPINLITVQNEDLSSESFSNLPPCDVQRTYGTTEGKKFVQGTDWIPLPSGLRLGVLAVHIDPDDVKMEMDALYNVTLECQRSAGTQNLVILGDMNADCKYLSKWDRNALRLRTDHWYKWLIEDGADTTVAKSDCAYDRLVLLSHIAANK
ncbi:Deoxyribonuclease-1-like 2 [Taenia solium]|eukprot:TsM_001025000 transcript=TsM_001025000 gene=TsM_001025000